MTDAISVPKELLQKVFDSAVGSMNFNSGFLDDEEVEALRTIAMLLGVDPWIATPPEFKPKYRRQEAARRGLTLEDDDTYRARIVAERKKFGAWRDGEAVYWARQTGDRLDKEGGIQRRLFNPDGTEAPQ